MYSKYLRSVVINYYHQVHSFRTVSNIFKVSKSTIHRWVKGYSPKPRTSKFLCLQKNIHETITNSPFLTLYQLRELLHKENNKISVSSLSRMLKKLKLTYKRVTKKFYYKSKESLFSKQKQYIESISNVNHDKILSIDETYFYNTTNHNYGWCSSKKRLEIYNKVNLKKQSMIMCISNKQIISHKVYAKNIDKSIYKQFINTFIHKFKDYYLLMDNVSFHKSKEIVDLVNEHNNILYIPPYSPQFNPIEELFSQLKNYIRKGNSLIDSIKKVNSNHLGGYYTHMKRYLKV